MIGDGARLIKATGEPWPGADRQRHTVHRLRNILAELPRGRALRDRMRGAYWTALDEAIERTEAERGPRALVGELAREYPSAAACLADDLQTLIVHLCYPPRLRKRLGSTNLRERSLKEMQRRVKVIGRLPGETCLSLCWAVLDLVIAGARGLGLTELDQLRLARLREERESGQSALAAST